ncbi:MAG: DUF4129 domain-containing protein [Candidatus Bipolaricaulia bacterium]
MIRNKARARRSLILALAGTLVAAVLLLAPSLSHLQFEGAKRPPSPEPRGVPESGPVPTLDFGLLWRILAWIVLALLPFSIVALFIWPEEFRLILIRIVTVTLILIILFFSVRALKGLLGRLSLPAENPGASGGVGGTGPVGVEELQLGEIQAPHWTVFPFLLIGLAALALIGWRLRRLFRARGRGEEPLAELAALAGAAAGELEAGGSLRDVVLRCYREMSQLLSEREKVPFTRAMTAREFEARLRGVGVRDDHVTQLSRLFEFVRYGGRASGPKEVAEAIACLEAIEAAYGGGDGRAA